ncbi:hypothetical protein VTN77DRAFT_7307 [Rasamsonia byssochlamydoides]|uniref:uncharacterized protein n=1 Tax=Rasamsonia byssochlamydoides TaxID=89139 RepID=UPI0037443868
MNPWKKRALEAGKLMDETWAKAMRLVEERRARGDHRPCLVDKLLDQYQAQSFPMTQHAFQNLLGEILEGGSDTASSQLLTLILALAKHPEVQRKAWLEIDAVCKCDRSPTWSDFDKLQYINCIVKEGMRWRPVGPLGLPHRVRQDDYYEGQLIPKDSTIFIPVWALHHSEQFGFYDPEKFDPDRYLDYPNPAYHYAGSPDYNKRDHYGYGAGRRLCPGIHLGERMQWPVIAKLLWAFEFSEPIDQKTGETISLDADAYTIGLVHAPLPFAVTIKPRSQGHIETIKRETPAAWEILRPWE